MSHRGRSIEQIREEVESSDMTRSDLLREIKEALREVRLSLPLYRSIQEPRRYQITLDDIEDAELMYQQFMNDSAGVFDDEDMRDTLIMARLKLDTVMSIIDRYSRGEWQTPRD
jgi:hypothetical protein